MPGLFRIGRVEDLDGIVVLFGPADVHPHQHLGPVGGVHPAGSRADGDDRLALVVLARQQGADLHRLDVLTQLLELGVGFGDGVGALCPLFFIGDFVEHRQVVDTLPQLLHAAQLTLGVGQLAGDLLGARLVVPQVGVGRLGLELFDARAQAFDVDHSFHGGQGGVECGDIGLPVEVHGSSRYRRLRSVP